MKHKKFEIPIWEYQVILVVGGDYSFILQIAERYKMSKKIRDDILFDKIAFDDRGAAYWCNETATGIIWFPKNKVDIGTLSHEVIHLIDFLSVYVGMETEMEARAYTGEWLITNIPKFLKKL